jgi:hypothetical protein
MNEQWTIALDLDGVFADFDKKISELNNGIPCASVPRGRLWASVGQYDEKVGPFFESLEKMQGADTLWNFVNSNFVNKFFLSAAGYTPKDGVGQKKRWVAKNYGNSVVCKVVTSSSDKAAFAGPNVILVDDRNKSIDPWVAAGGIGVLHKSAEDTIRQLKEIVGI